PEEFFSPFSSSVVFCIFDIKPVSPIWRLYLVYIINMEPESGLSIASCRLAPCLVCTHRVVVRCTNCNERNEESAETLGKEEMSFVRPNLVLIGGDQLYVFRFEPAAGTWSV